MNEPEIPANEGERLASLRRLCLLDTPPEARFDRVTRIARAHFQVPIALVSLIDEGRQWFKSRQGLAAMETSRDISFCGHAILDDVTFVVANALTDPRFADNPLVTGGPNIRFYAGAPLHAADGHRVGTLCVIDDKPRVLTAADEVVLRDLADCVESELARSAMAHNYRFVRAIANAIPGLVSYWDDRLVCRFANAAHGPWFATKPESLLGMRMAEGEERFALVPSQVTLALSGAPRQFERTVTRADGGEVEALINYVPDVDPDLGVIGIFVLATDISGLKAIERELRRSNTDLEQFAYAVSHDLRQPVRTVCGFLRMAGESLDRVADPDALEALAMAAEGTERLDRMIVSLLELSRVGRGGRKPHAVALANVIDDSLFDLKTAIEEAGATVKVAPEPPEVRGDEPELARLFDNLIGNALKYRQPETPPMVEIAFEDAGGHWRVTIADNGIGIDPKDHQRAFGIFQRLVNDSVCQGSGIGLALCQKIVTHHGGRIWIDSSKGAGCRVNFTLPKAR